MTKYKELSQRLNKINLGVVSLKDFYGKKAITTYQVYFKTGMRKGEILSNVTSLESLEQLCGINGV